MNAEPQRLGYKPTYKTRDIWQAAYCMTYGCRLLATYLDDEGRVTWEVANDEDAAFQAGKDFRTGGDFAVVPIQRFRTYFRIASKASQDARREGVSYAPATRD